jgi:phosphoribosylformylglycinamidine (FGAM) synthase-like amidotransferase family enzyme
MKAVRVLVLTGYGLNCDVETAYAFDLAGACSERVHINSLIDGDARVDGFHILAFVGGFSWGDDHGAGVVQAVRLRYNLGSQFQKFIKDGMLIIGICNGFQTLVNLGLLPGLVFTVPYRLPRTYSTAFCSIRIPFVGPGSVDSVVRFLSSFMRVQSGWLVQWLKASG